MHDFGQFCYLDVPKTGSTFISTFLKKHSALQQVEFRKHRRLHKHASMAPGKFFFISIREPLETYKSLYSYGVNQKGALFAQMTRQEERLRTVYDGTAEGFSNWLRFVMDPKNIALFASHPDDDGRLFGPMTHRFLTLSFFQPGKLLRKASDFDSLVEVYEKNKVHSAIVRNESLNEDMALLVEGPLGAFISDPETAAAELRSTRKKTNASARVDRRVELALEPELLAHLHERERFLYDIIGYGQLRA